MARMPLELARIEEAISYILRNPGELRPFGDTVRLAAIQDLQTINYSTHLTWTPQNSTSPFALTIQKLGGQAPVNTDSWASSSYPVISITTWARTTGNRTKISQLLDLGLLVRVLLNGLRGTWAGVTIHNILIENEPILSDEQPSDASDNWMSGYTFDYVAMYDPTNASNRIASP